MEGDFPSHLQEKETHYGFAKNVKILQSHSASLSSGNAIGNLLPLHSLHNNGIILSICTSICTHIFSLFF